jgi:hypothetical protein
MYLWTIPKVTKDSWIMTDKTRIRQNVLRYPAKLNAGHTFRLFISLFTAFDQHSRRIKQQCLRLGIGGLAF